MSYITYPEFVEFSEEFLAISEALGDSWTKVDDIRQYGTGFLVKKHTKHIRKTIPISKNIIKDDVLNKFTVCSSTGDNVIKDSQLEVFFSEDFDNMTINSLTPSDFDDNEQNFPTLNIEDDPSEYKPPSKQGESYEPVLFEYNIVYNVSHSVPMLCFEAHHLTGTGAPLQLDEVLSSVVDNNFSRQIWMRRWESLTIGEHPVKGSPCFMIHPCKTAALMKQVLINRHSEVVLRDANSAKLETSCAQSANNTRSHDTGIFDQETSHHGEHYSSNANSRKPYSFKPITTGSVVAECSGSCGRSADYLISWLSMVGPVVGLNLHLRYFQNR